MKYTPIARLAVSRLIGRNNFKIPLDKLGEVWYNKEKG